MKIKAMPGDVDSASGLDGEKEDHERSNFKNVLRRKLQEMQWNKVKYHLESWHKQRSATGFRVGILHLTSKPCPLEDSELAIQYPNRMLVLRSQGYDRKTEPFHPVRLVRLVHLVNGEWSLQCPILEYIVLK